MTEISKIKGLILLLFERSKDLIHGYVQALRKIFGKITKRVRANRKFPTGKNEADRL